MAGEIHYLADKRTCVMPVKLESGKTYVLWFSRGPIQEFPGHCKQCLRALPAGIRNDEIICAQR